MRKSFGFAFAHSENLCLNSCIIFANALTIVAKIHKIAEDILAFFLVENILYFIGLNTARSLSDAINNKCNIEAITKETYRVYTPPRISWNLQFRNALSVKTKPFNKPNIKSDIDKLSKTISYTFFFLFILSSIMLLKLQLTNLWTFLISDYPYHHN